MSRMERIKTAPSHYPPLPFHIIRTAQLVSSAVVFSTMCYFVWWLIHDHWPTPWTFILLLAVSLFTILSLSATIVLHCCVGLNPVVNMIVNGALSVIWLVGFSLLSWFMSRTLTHWCNVTNWDGDVGIMVCRIYKSLFSFSLLGLVSTLLAFYLDIYVRMRSTRRGIYHNMAPIDPKKSAAAHEYPVPATGASTSNPFADPQNPFSDNHAAPQAPGHESPYANRMPSPYLRSPNDPEAGGFSHDAHARGGEGVRVAENDTKSPIDYLKGPFSKQNKPESGGYEVPNEQFKYDDDTEYRGAHGEL